MRYLTKGALGLAAVLLVATEADAPLPVAAQSVPQVGVTGELRVEGGSTVRAWDCEAPDIRTDVRVRQNLGSLSVAELEGAVTSLRVRIPTATLACGNDTMQEHMWNALETRDHPWVEFRMEEYRVSGTNGVSARVELRGSLEIAGSRRPVSIPVTVEQNGDGLRVQGSQRLDMTEWGVRPPRLMMGTLRVHDEVDVLFNLHLSLR